MTGRHRWLKGVDGWVLLVSGRWWRGSGQAGEGEKERESKIERESARESCREREHERER